MPHPTVPHSAHWPTALFGPVQTTFPLPLTVSGDWPWLKAEAGTLHRGSQDFGVKPLLSDEAGATLQFI